MSQRKRSKVGRYDPKLMQALRAEITKHPNPMFGEMLKENRVGDGDVMDFALRVALSYFSGELLEPVTAAAGRELERLMRRTLLRTVAYFDATATFTADGGANITLLKGADADTRTAAVQALVDTGMSVKEAQSLLADSPPQGQSSWTLPAPMLSATVVN